MARSALWFDKSQYRRERAKALRLGHTGLLPDFGEILRSKRRDMKMTQAQVAEKVGCSPGTIRNLEGGQRVLLPRRSIFWGLARALDLSPREMLEAAGYLEASKLRSVK